MNDCCDNPFRWKVINDDGKNVTVECGTCGKQHEFDYYKKCPKCGFWLQEDGFCEMCEEQTIDSPLDQKCRECGFWRDDEDFCIGCDGARGITNALRYDRKGISPFVPC